MKRETRTYEDRRKYWAAVYARRLELIEEMGGVCNYCGTTEDLQFNHTKKRTWSSGAVSRVKRIELYRRDFEADVLNLACGDCNRRHGQPVDDEGPDPDFVAAGENDF